MKLYPSEDSSSYYLNEYYTVIFPHRVIIQKIKRNKNIYIL